MIKNLPYDKILNYLILLYAFFIPLSLDMLRILSISMVIIWIFYGNFKEKIALIKQEPFFYSIGLYILVLILALFWTEPENLRFGIKYFTRYWYLLPMLVIYTSLDKKYIFPTISAFLLGMFISELVSYSVFFEFIHLDKVPPSDPSPFMQHTLYSIFLVFSGGVLLNRMLESHSLKENIVYGVFFTTITVNLFVNSGRTGQVLFLFVLSTVIFSHYKFTLKSFFIAIVLLFTIPYLSYTYSPNFKQRMLQSSQNIHDTSYTSSIGVRYGLVIVAKDIFLENPVFGVGTGDYLDAKEKTIDKNYPDRNRLRHYVHYHNEYAENIVIAGIIGLLAYLNIFFSLYRITLHDKRIQTIKNILIITFLLSSLTDAVFHLNRPLSLFALFVGLILAQKRYEQLIKRED